MLRGTVRGTVRGTARIFLSICILVAVASGCSTSFPMLVPNEEKTPLPTINDEQWIQGIEVKVLDIE